MSPREVTARRAFSSCVVLTALLAGCYGDETDLGVSARVDSLTVGGYPCPTHGEIAGRTRPADNLYYLTTFGGGADTQPMACGGVADGRWLYIADSWRFSCGAHVRVSNPHNNRSCVAQVADVGPNICVEQAAGRAVIDASPAVARYLFNVGGVGWSDRVSVEAVAVSNSIALGCTDVPPPVVRDAGMPAPDASAPADVAAPPVDAALRDAVATDVVAARDVVAMTDVVAVRDGGATTDVAVADARADDAAVPPADTLNGGCSCSAGAPRGRPSHAALLLVGLALAAAFARRRAT